MRLFHLYHELSHHFDITLLTSTHFESEAELVQHNENFKEFRIPKDDDWRTAYESLRSAGVEGEVSSVAFSLAVSNRRNRFREEALKHAYSADLVVHDSPFSEPIFSDGCNVPEIYNAYNVELGLISSLIYGKGSGIVFSKVAEIELTLTKRAAHIMVTSQDDLEQLRILSGRARSDFTIVPNGFASKEADRILCARRKVARKDSKNYVFIASSHQPNIDAAHFIITVADKCPSSVFHIVGTVCEHVSEANQLPNVVLHGKVDQGKKEEILIEADAILNPVTSGSGTNLKSIEALACGIPLVTTRFGARGLDLSRDYNVIYFDNLDFVSVNDSFSRMDPSLISEIAARGRAHYEQRLTWSSIALTAAETIRAAIHAASTEKKLQQKPSRLTLALNDYSVSGNFGGGAERIREIYKTINKDTVILTTSDKPGIHMLSDSVLEISCPKMINHIEMERRYYKLDTKISKADIITSLYIKHNPVVQLIISKLISRANLVAFEHCYMAPLLDMVLANVHSNCPIIYSAHNVEADLKDMLLPNDWIKAYWISHVRKLEARLIQNSSAVLCCSKADADYFLRQNASQVILLPNGTKAPKNSVEDGNETNGFEGRKKVGFIGSMHPPNVAAVQFIELLAMKMSWIDFEIIGSAGEAVKNPLPNIIVCGNLSDDDKSRRMFGWTLALNPLTVGGGTSLKLADYLAHGLTTISTETGARGLQESYKSSVVISQLDDFEYEINKALSSSRGALTVIRSSGLYWENLTKEYVDYIESRQPVAETARPRLLIVAQSYCEPPLTHAENYIGRIVPYLRPYADSIDLAVIDLSWPGGKISYRPEEHRRVGAAGVLSAAFSRVNFFSPDADSYSVIKLQSDEISRRREVFRAEARRQTMLSADVAGDRVLTSGISAEGEIGRFGVMLRLPKEKFRSFVLIGRTDQSASLLVHFDNKISSVVRSVEAGEFALIYTVPENFDPENILQIEVVDDLAENPHIRNIQLISVGLVNESGRTYLVNYKQFYRVDQSTNENPEFFRSPPPAVGRSSFFLDNQETLDGTFAPRSKEMDNWLLKNHSHYDCIIIIGAPRGIDYHVIHTLLAVRRVSNLVAILGPKQSEDMEWWNTVTSLETKADLIIADPCSEALIASVEGIKSVALPFNAVPADEDIGIYGYLRRKQVDRTYFVVITESLDPEQLKTVLHAKNKLRAEGYDFDVIEMRKLQVGFFVDDGKKQDLVPYSDAEKVASLFRDSVAVIKLSSPAIVDADILQGWKYKRPVICNSKSKSHGRLIHHGLNGFLASGVNDMRDFMRDLLSNPDKADNLGAAGNHALYESYTWDKISEYLLASFRDLNSH
jgi:glycosyltransferase involved in cell wall biosynthesis